MAKSAEGRRLEGAVASYSHIVTWLAGLACAGAAMWIQVNYPTRKEFKEATTEMLQKIDVLVRSVNEQGLQLAIVRDRQEQGTLRIIDIDHRLKTIEIKFPGPIPMPGDK